MTVTATLSIDASPSTTLFFKKLFTFLRKFVHVRVRRWNPWPPFDVLVDSLIRQDSSMRHETDRRSPKPRWTTYDEELFTSTRLLVIALPSAFSFVLYLTNLFVYLFIYPSIFSLSLPLSISPFLSSHRRITLHSIGFVLRNVDSRAGS